MSSKIQDTVVKHSLMKAVREVTAMILWASIVMKVIVFDIDVYVFEKYLPSLRLALNYRFFALLVLISVVLIGIRKKTFRSFFAYIISYPLILLFWRIPKLFFRNWALTIAFAPALYDLLRSFRSRFILMTAAALSALCIVLSSTSQLLIPSMVLLGVYLVMHLYRSLRKAYRSSIFQGLADLVKKMRVGLKGGQQALWKKEKYDSGTTEYQQQCLTFYLFNTGVEIVGEKLLKVAKSRRPDLYLMISWLTTVLLTSLIYAFEYWSLYKIDALSFTPNYTLSFWSFWGFSFGKLTPSSISAIGPVSGIATVLSYSELFCALIILVILVFSVLTAAREKYREDIGDFVSEVGNLGRDLQEQFFPLYALAVADVELVLLSSNAVLINQVRKARGLPNLSIPEKSEQAGAEDAK